MIPFLKTSSHNLMILMIQKTSVVPRSSENTPQSVMSDKIGCSREVDEIVQFTPVFIQSWISLLSVSIFPHSVLSQILRHLVDMTLSLVHQASGVLPGCCDFLRIEKVGNEEIRARAGVVNISEKIRDTRLKWFGRMEKD